MNYINISISLKIIVELVISYLILTKGEAGQLVHDLGAFLHSGNAFLCFLSLAILLIGYLIVVFSSTLKYAKQF